MSYHIIQVIQYLISVGLVFYLGIHYGSTVCGLAAILYSVASFPTEIFKEFPRVKS